VLLEWLPHLASYLDEELIAKAQEISIHLCDFDMSGTLKFDENEIFRMVSRFQPEKKFNVGGMKPPQAVPQSGAMGGKGGE
jgi:hypothetical protein